VKSLCFMMIPLTDGDLGIVQERLTGVVMGSRIPTVRMKSRFYRLVAGGAAFCIYDELVNLES
jgi:hypothetical protein